MNFYLTKYSTDNIQFPNLFNFFEETEKLFNPPISERRNLLEYVEKLTRESIILIAKDTKTNIIIGVAAYYCTPEVFEYAFLTYIATKSKIKGVGSNLLNKMIKDCKVKGMVGIETQTWESNQKSLTLFQKYGFVIEKYLNNRKGSERSVILRLIF